KPEGRDEERERPLDLWRGVGAEPEEIHRNQDVGKAGEQELEEDGLLVGEAALGRRHGRELSAISDQLSASGRRSRASEHPFDLADFIGQYAMFGGGDKFQIRSEQEMVFGFTCRAVRDVDKAFQFGVTATPTA